MSTKANNRDCYTFRFIEVIMCIETEEYTIEPYTSVRVVLLLGTTVNSILQKYKTLKKSKTSLVV